jgi:hypothetical protein
VKGKGEKCIAWSMKENKLAWATDHFGLPIDIIEPGLRVWYCARLKLEL